MSLADFTPSLRPAALLACVMLSSALVGCDEGAGPSAPGTIDWEWDIPTHFPTPRVPAENPMSEAKVELGRQLFYDEGLSGDGKMSCASCHHQELAFTDGVDRPTGITGDLHPRSSMSLANVVYNGTLTWANPLLTTLEEQAFTPLFGENPIEMGNRTLQDVEAYLEAHPTYPQRFAAAFPASDDPVSVAHVLDALASFQRSLISANSPYDQYIAGDTDAMSESAKRGMDLFFSERLECFHCHGGFTFSSSLTHDQLLISESGFHNNGLYNVDELGSYPANNPGIYEFSGEDADRGAFRAPTLRNIAVTAPYMHDGSLLTLTDVVEHYARGGTLTVDGPNAGDGANNPNKSAFITGFLIDEDEVDDLIAFLEALTDKQFLNDPRFQDPALDAP